MKLTVCILAILAMTVFASDPRLNVLARGDARLLVDDYNEMWAYPGTIGDYQFAQISSVNAAGGWDLGWFGGVKQIGDATWGGTHNHNGYLLECLYHGGNYGIIVGLDYSSNIGIDTIMTMDELDFGVAFGTEINFLGRENDLALGGSYHSTTLSIDTVDSENSVFNGGVSLRGDNGDALVNLFPIMSAGFASYSNEDAMDKTIISADFGGGINKMYTPSTRFIAGIFIGVENTSFSVDSGDAPDSQMDIDIMDISFGAEQQLFNWFYLRAGGDMVTDYFKQGDADAVISTSYSDSYGIGFAIGNFDLDAEISDVFLHDGPYMVSGNSNGFMSNLSCSYYF
jgi:hypothetical protein